MGNIHEHIKRDLLQINESAEKIKKIAAEDIEKLKGETEKIKELAEKDKKRFLKSLFNGNKQDESI